jgi:hypothetical protein
MMNDLSLVMIILSLSNLFCNAWCNVFVQLPIGEEDSGLPYGLVTVVAADSAGRSTAERDRELKGPQELFRANTRLAKAEVGPAIKVALVREQSHTLLQSNRLNSLLFIHEGETP